MPSWRGSSNCTATARRAPPRAAHRAAPWAVLVVHMTPSGPWPKATLTDASGALMPSQGASAPTADSADMILGFDPLPRPHSGSNPLTLPCDRPPGSGYERTDPWRLDVELRSAVPGRVGAPEPRARKAGSGDVRDGGGVIGRHPISISDGGGDCGCARRTTSAPAVGPNGKPVLAEMAHWPPSAWTRCS
jgi:hypothetical protein